MSPTVPVPGLRPALFPEQLHRRATRSGAGPLVTYYDRPAGVRTELSGASFANWVDKTANLLVDELDLAPGDLVALPLLAAHPGHWVSLVWVAACWRARAAVTPGPHPDAALEVVGPEDAAAAPEPGRIRVACSLHPLGLGFAEPLPAGVLDFSTEARSQPDVFLGAAVSGATAPDDRAWTDGDTELDQLALLDPAAGTAAAGGPAGSARVLVVPGAPWSTVRAALVAPVLGDGSAVVVVGAGLDDLAGLAATERADVTVEL